MIASTMQRSPLTVPTLFRHGLSLYGDSQVVTLTEHGTRRRSFKEIGDRSARLANALRGFGVTDGTPVATFQWNNAEHLESYLAVPSIGAVLHTVNIRLAAEQIVHVFNHAEDEVLIADGSALGVLSPLMGQLVTLRHLVVCGTASPSDLEELSGLSLEVHDYEELLSRSSAEAEWAEPVDEFAPAGMCYTSGTTGKPRGVVYSHRSTYLHAMAVCTGNFLGITEADRVLSIVPMFHANAWGLPYAGWLAGSDLLMPDRHMQPSSLSRFIATEKATISAGVPTVWNDLLRYSESADVDLSSLRILGVGGSAVPISLMRDYQERFGLELIQGFGMTETSPMAAVSRPPKGTPCEDKWAWRSKTGRVMAGVEARVLDTNGSVLPNDGVSVGELELSGPWVTGNYHKDEDSEKFHDGWLRTGDIGTIDGRGYMQITDRLKDVIKSGGEWISSVDLENTLMSHPDVAEAAVIAIPDERWAERPLALIVVNEGTAVAPIDLRTHLLARFAPWQVPDRWAYIDAVPRTSVGKFNKLLLREKYSRGEIEILTPAAT